MTVQWNSNAADVKADPLVAAALLVDGTRIAQKAAEYAPKRTGSGARSIRAEIVRGKRDDPEVRVSWTTDAFYMAFVEFGTEHQSAESFLRRAAQEFK